MQEARPVALLTALVLAVMAASCSHSTTTKTAATPAPSPSPAPAAAPPQTASAPATGAPVRPRRVPLSRDSLAHLRANYVATVMQQIAGRENEPAGQVFKNVKELSNLTAGELVHMMDTTYGRALSWNCTNCHRAVNGVVADWSSDTLRNKQRARFMQQMVQVINTEQLPKQYPRDTPQITCVTCHRGYNEPPPSSVLVPPFGAPGGPPIPERFGPPPGAAPAGRPPR